MKILIDADGCPVTGITVRIAKQKNISCMIICDTAHRIQYDGVETIIVEKGADSADYRLVNLVQAGDLVLRTCSNVPEQKLNRAESGRKTVH